MYIWRHNVKVKFVRGKYSLFRLYSKMSILRLQTLTKSIILKNFSFVEICPCWLGRLQVRGRSSRRRGQCRGWDPGSCPLDVRDGWAHEPRVKPSSSLHVDQWDRSEDESFRATTTTSKRLFIYFNNQILFCAKTTSIARIICAPKPQLQQYIIQK